MQPMGEGVVGEGPVRVHAVDDDLGHRVELGEVDPFEGGDDGASGRRAPGRRCEPDVGASFRGRPRRARCAVRSGRAGCRSGPGRRPFRGCPARGRGRQRHLDPASVSRSASSRPMGISTRSRSTPPATGRPSLSSASSMSGSSSVVPIHGWPGSPSMDRSRDGRSLGIDPLDRGRGEALRPPPPRPPGGRLAQEFASIARSTAPAATSRASCCGSRSYSSRAIANGSVPPPVRSGWRPASGRRRRRERAARGSSP